MKLTTDSSLNYSINFLKRNGYFELKALLLITLLFDYKIIYGRIE